MERVKLFCDEGCVERSKRRPDDVFRACGVTLPDGEEWREYYPIFFTAAQAEIVSGSRAKWLRSGGVKHDREASPAMLVAGTVLGAERDR
ncbi:hypothetical protein GCM10020360_23020 [Nonlabens tegetincola]